MAKYNIVSSDPVDVNYSRGLLPQRNRRDLYYADTSCRSNLENFTLSSENRRIITKTNHFSSNILSLSEYPYSPQLQKQLSLWAQKLGWDFPTSSIKTIFTHHIFNTLFVWFDSARPSQPIAFAVCYFSPEISHIAYVFYHPDFSHHDLPIRLTLETIIESHRRGLKFCYLGRFDPEQKIGYYKRNLPGFEFFKDHQWQKY